MTMAYTCAYFERDDMSLQEDAIYEYSQRERAITVHSEEVYHRYLRYLTGCADLFRGGSAMSGSSP